MTVRMLITCVATFLSLALTAKDDVIQKELEKLQGAWAQISAVSPRQPHPRWLRPPKTPRFRGNMPIASRFTTDYTEEHGSDP